MLPAECEVEEEDDGGFEHVGSCGVLLVCVVVVVVGGVGCDSSCVTTGGGVGCWWLVCVALGLAWLWSLGVVRVCWCLVTALAVVLSLAPVAVPAGWFLVPSLCGFALCGLAGGAGLAVALSSLLCDPPWWNHPWSVWLLLICAWISFAFGGGWSLFNVIRGGGRWCCIECVVLQSYLCV